MAAVHHFCESNGAGEVETQDIAHLNFGSTDATGITPATYPITRPDSSFEKYLRCLFTGVWVEISNMLFWKSAGAYVTGEGIKAAANVEYAQPSDVTNADSAIPTAVESALAIESAEGAETIEYGASGVSGYTKYIRLQMDTTIATPAGAVNQKTFTFQYDEL